MFAASGDKPIPYGSSSDRTRFRSSRCPRGARRARRQRVRRPGTGRPRATSPAPSPTRVRSRCATCRERDPEGMLVRLRGDGAAAAKNSSISSGGSRTRTSSVRRSFAPACSFFRFSVCGACSTSTGGTRRRPDSSSSQRIPERTTCWRSRNEGSSTRAGTGAGRAGVAENQQLASSPLERAPKLVEQERNRSSSSSPRRPPGRR